MGVPRGTLLTEPTPIGGVTNKQVWMVGLVFVLSERVASGVVSSVEGTTSQCDGQLSRSLEMHVLLEQQQGVNIGKVHSDAGFM
jgi:hypothetical protein